MALRSSFPLALALSLVLAYHGNAAWPRDHEMETLSQRLFPTLSALVGSNPWPKDAGGARLLALLVDRRAHRKICAAAPSCIIKAALWSPSDTEVVADAIARRGGAASSMTSPDGVRAQVLRELRGLNSILTVYGLGGASRYPQIDGPGPMAGSPEFAARLAAAVALAEAGSEDQRAAFDPSLDLALALLDVNGRLDAAKFEPLDTRFNEPAMARAGRLDWSRYAYTAIIVLGEGPEDLATPLSALGKLRIKLAVERYFDGAAPFIILTGGAVHPRGTHYVEALQMRQALMERFSVPADSIIVEPYARHTTTNLRNAARRLFALKSPADREALIVTDADQSRYIESVEFRNRNQQELGYQPGLLGRRLSPTELTFRPAPESAIVDPLDPLDP